MKRETWLQANRRIFGAALMVYGGLAMLALATVAGAVANSLPRWIASLAGVVLAFAMLGVVWLVVQLSRPRLGFHDGNLLVFVRQGPPARVPVTAVECFLLGRGATFLPGRQFAEVETVTLVVRISPKVEALRQQSTDPRLGSWCDSHITLRGTWCEPLTVSRVNDLNARLAAAQKAIRATARDLQTNGQNAAT
ncbi:MAG: hypothetical protein K2Y37_10040 [Pirellulales bacterium]|nr:hypothetical protein [Pirellulales bacterium]